MPRPKAAHKKIDSSFFFSFLWQLVRPSCTYFQRADAAAAVVGAKEALPVTAARVAVAVVRAVAASRIAARANTRFARNASTA